MRDPFWPGEFSRSTSEAELAELMAMMLLLSFTGPQFRQDGLDVRELRRRGFSHDALAGRREDNQSREDCPQEYMSELIARLLSAMRPAPDENCYREDCGDCAVRLIPLRPAPQNVVAGRSRSC